MKTLFVLAIAVMAASAEEQCLRDAWKTYNQGDYAAAIRFADGCISNFHLQAERNQVALADHHEPEPATGAVSDADKRKIFARGVLNDTAAAYFVKGESAKALAKRGGPRAREFRETARAAYESAKKLTYGRVWDPQGWFWSPSEMAGDRLADLK